MKKKILIVLTIFFITIFTTGCFKKDKMEDINILTTVYPINYIIDNLYGSYSNITSIYPKGSNPSSYKLTNKQLKDYSSSDLLIYNGISDEKNYAKELLNLNSDLKIIDASYGIDYINSEKEIWLNPSNMLMMAQNIKRELKSYISNPYIIEDLEKNYEQFKVNMSELDSKFKNVAQNSNNVKIITSDETFNFIQKYGFDVINLTKNGEIISKNVTTAQSLLKDKKLTYVFVMENEETNTTIEKLISDNKAKKIVLKTLSNITDNDSNNNEDYLSIMNDNIDNIALETY